ncbi:unnamed protein product [Schistosoma mattheei]|uniref:Uncharacterized protein n=1 Tax=Schistosoma mattheei TaxID=31246 RepID=A0A183NTG5_9TREM|nr:unnamed protein product [Schistosoma mattheei]
MSNSNSLRNVFFGLPFLLLPSGFQVTACFVMQFCNFHYLCPIHSQRFFLIPPSAGNWFVPCHSRLLLMMSDQWIWTMLRRQLFINTCTFLMRVLLVLKYNRVVLTFVLIILILMLADSCFEFSMFFSCILPRRLKLPTSSRVPRSSMIWLVLCLFHFRTSLFPL